MIAKLMKNRKGMVTKNLSIGTVITGVILLVVLFKVLATALPEVNTAGAELNATGLPLATFFQDNGIIMLAIMGAVIVVILGFVGLKKGR